MDTKRTSKESQGKNSLTLLYILFLDPFHTQKVHFIKNAHAHEHVYLYYHLIAYLTT